MTTSPDQNTQLISPEELQEQKFRDLFWNKLQYDLGVRVPIHIKNIFKLTNLDNPVSFRGITDEVIKNTETFAKTTMISLIDEESYVYKDYYGIFHKKPESFYFLDGDLILLKSLVEYVKSTTLQYWGLNNSSTKPQVSNMSQGISFIPETPDIEKELKKLVPLVHSVIAKIREKIDESEAKSLSLDVKIEVTPLQKPDNTGITYRAEIGCSMCNTIVRISKVAGKSNERWVTSNYVRHLKAHFDKKLINTSFVSVESEELL